MNDVRWHSCNIIESKAETRKLWEFDIDDGEVKPGATATLPVGKGLPPKTVRKDWRSLWQPKLNVAWLPEESVFLRVIELPAAEQTETASMVELQLEKLSPMPVAQIVWSFESLPRTKEGLQTIIVIIAARSVVESFLGKLEADGFLADRLELPMLQHFLSVKPDGDGPWIHLKPGPLTTISLTGWWFDGVLKNLSLAQLPAGAAGVDALVRTLTQTAWAGEIEGWIKSYSEWHLVADTETASLWAAELSLRIPEKIKTYAAPTEAKLAALSARHSVRSNGRVSLLPADYAATYRQQFIDGLWMKSVGVLLSLYVIGLLIYFGAVQVLRFQEYRLENLVRDLTPGHTNAIQSQARIQVLQEQSNLRFAALDCWRAASEMLPTELTLEHLIFTEGRALQLHGYTQNENQTKITDYNQSMRTATNANGLLFSNVSTPNISLVPGQAGPQTAKWVFNCELNTKEDQ